MRLTARCFLKDLETYANSNLMWIVDVAAMVTHWYLPGSRVALVSVSDFVSMVHTNALEGGSSAKVELKTLKKVRWCLRNPEHVLITCSLRDSAASTHFAQPRDEI